MEDYIIRALDGDREAFGRLYDRYAGAALRLSMAVTRRPALAEDAVQEAFLRVFRKGRQWRRGEPFEPWFFRIVINESRRLLSRQEPAGELPEEVGAPGFAERSDLSMTVAAALDRLSEEHRTVLVLRFLLERTEREIAGILSLPLGTVKSRVHYAKKALAEQLEKEEMG